MKKKALSELDSIIAGFNGDNEKYLKLRKVVDSVNDYLIDLNSPYNFDTERGKSILIDLDLGFQKLCASLEEVGVHKPERLTLFEMYAKVQFFEEKAKNSSKRSD